MDMSTPVTPAAFEAMQNVDIDRLCTLSDSELRPILPCLVRMSLCCPLDSSATFKENKKKILKLLSDIEVVNSLVGLLSIDFHALELDARAEMMLRTKRTPGVSQATESQLISSLESSVEREFERSDCARKLRIMLSELLFVMSQVNEPSRNGENNFYQKVSALFDSDIIFEEVSDVLGIAQAELPLLLPVPEVAEALLHVNNGIWIMCRLVACVPDSFEEVITSLVKNGERQDDDNAGVQARVGALKALCNMCPSHALTVRALCVENCKLPSLAIYLTLQQHELNKHNQLQMTAEAMETDADPDPDQSLSSDMIAFVSGLLLGNDSNQRAWMAQCIRAGQKRKEAVVGFHALRLAIIEELKGVLPSDGSNNLADDKVVEACSFIKLYCAMKSIAGMRFNEEEMKLLLNLITCQPPYTSAGIRFVTLSLCMLLAAPYLISSAEDDKQTVNWLTWLVQESSTFEQYSEGTSSFGEMLLLIAIHFHSTQNAAISNLVSSTLGMKSPVKANSLSRLKVIFTKEVFSEQLVASHAVKVAVTKDLSAEMTGYLPIHCVYQLLKSRAFSKHKVPIKEWLLSQICACTTPLHPLVISLLEVYINSILLPPSHKDPRPSEGARTNQPITEEEILAVFRHSEVARHFSSKTSSVEMDQPVETDSSRLTSQLLLLYYVLLYNDTLTAKSKDIAHRRDGSKVVRYSDSLMAQLPMKYLLQKAQKQQHLYAPLFASLLRLLVSQYPQLCLVEDWMDEELSSPHPSTTVLKQTPTAENLQAAFASLSNSPTPVLLILEHLVTMETTDLLPYADVIIANLNTLLKPGVPRRVMDYMKTVWLKLNTAMPRKLRAMTVNALASQQPTSSYHTDLRMLGITSGGLYGYTEEDLVMDPLLVLRCIDPRVYSRCPPMVEVLLRVMDAFLLASRTHLNAHVANQAQQVGNDEADKREAANKEELKSALIIAQESAAVQLLLEACLHAGKDDTGDKKSLLSNKREVQCLVCTQLHRMFINDTNLAKLVHFQGYPPELLAITVPGIPSLHVCLDFIPELLSQPHLEKTMFAVELVSHLSLQYALPKSLSVARLAITVLTTLLTVISADVRPAFYGGGILPSVVRISRAFPALSQDVISFLMLLARVCNSHLSSSADTMLTEIPCACARARPSTGPEDEATEHENLCHSIQSAFKNVVRSTRLLQHRYPVSTS